MDPNLHSQAIMLLASTFATHFWFRNFEPEAYIPVFIAGLLFPAPLTYLLAKGSHNIITAIFYGYPCSYASLIASIVAYRLSPFHPLARYPGPLMARATKLWAVWKSRDGKLQHYYAHLHARHGTIVRIGPNELSVVDKDLIPYILGSQGMPKGPLWDGRRITPSDSRNRGNYSLISQRSSARHAQLRKAWNRAFSAEALLDYQDIVVNTAHELANKLEHSCIDGQNGIDIGKCISHFAFDFMGDLAFSCSFEMLQHGDKHGYQAGMEKGLLLPSLTQQVPWLAHVIRLLPYGGSATNAFGAFAVKQAKNRSNQSITRKDLFYHLVNNTYSDEEVSPFPLIVSNAVLAIIAGSDSTASVLSNIIYYLLSNPSDLRRLREEIDQAFPSLGDDPTSLDVAKLANLQWLNAVINETLRLQPPLPTSMQRAPEKGSGGKMVGTMFVKEGTAILVPPFVLHRDPRYFSPDPHKFWPERWVQFGKDPEVVLELGAFIPFSTGPANCVGKQLALMELRFVVALLLSRFEISFAAGWDPRSWEANLKDRFGLCKGELMVNVKLRRE